MIVESTFSENYTTARSRFLAAAESARCRLETHSIDQLGPDGKPLTIDVAILGDDSPSRALVVSSGLHGVEGFFGSAVQVGLLEGVVNGTEVPKKTALILIHALDPFGFAHLR